MLPPEEHGGQRLLKRELRVDGADDVRLLSQMDQFGNVVYHVSSPMVTEAVAFTAEFEVERFTTAERLRVPPRTRSWGSISIARRYRAGRAHSRRGRALSAEITRRRRRAGAGCLERSRQLDVEGIRR